MSGVGIWTDRQNQEGGLTGSVGVGRVAIFNALKGMPSFGPPSLPASACVRALDEIRINPLRIAQASLSCTLYGHLLPYKLLALFVAIKRLRERDWNFA